MDRTRPGSRDHLDSLPPGAERFWGQFAETRAGRTGCQEDTGSDRGARDTAEEPGHRCLEWCPICRSAELAGFVATPDLLDYVQTVQGDLVTILRAFVDAYWEQVADSDQESPGRTEPDGPQV